MFTEVEWKNLREVYTTILLEIENNLNLEKNLKLVIDGIEELEKIIQKERLTKSVTPGLDDIKNDFFYLKFLILEKI